jgi:nitrate reductase beta subunit
VILYDADRIERVAGRPDRELAEAQREMILDPSDPEILRKAREDGVHEAILEAAVKSPVYRYLKEWKLALPLHVEFGTLPMLFYIPPLLPVAASVRSETSRRKCWNVPSPEPESTQEKQRQSTG